MLSTTLARPNRPGRRLDGPGPATARVTCPSRRAALAADADTFVGNAVVPAPSRERALANIRLRPTTVDVIHPDALAAAEGHAVTPAANYRSCALYPTAQLAADHTRVGIRPAVVANGAPATNSHKSVPWCIYYIKVAMYRNFENVCHTPYCSIFFIERGLLRMCAISLLAQPLPSHTRRGGSRQGAWAVPVEG